MVYQIKELSPKLNVYALNRLPRLDHREVPVVVTEITKGVASHATELPRIGRHKHTGTIYVTAKAAQRAYRCVRQTCRIAESLLGHRIDSKGAGSEERNRSIGR